jgi:hypothetical protein
MWALSAGGHDMRNATLALAITLAGVTTSSLVFAVLYSNRSGRYVQAVTPTTGKFTIWAAKANAAITPITGARR